MGISSIAALQGGVHPAGRIRSAVSDDECPHDYAASSKRAKSNPKAAILTLSLAATIALMPSMSHATGRPTGLAAELGTAIQTNGRLCLAMALPAIPAHTAVIIIDARNRLQTATGGIGGRADACPGMQPGMNAYALRAIKGHLADDVVLFGIIGAVQVLDHNGSVTIRRRAGSQELTLRSCTSAEGVHLTTWRDAAMSSPRLWHSYTYLGQDLDASCSAKESSE